MREGASLEFFVFGTLPRYLSPNVAIIQLRTTLFGKVELFVWRFFLLRFCDEGLLFPHNLQRLIVLHYLSRLLEFF